MIDTYVIEKPSLSLYPNLCVVYEFGVHLDVLDKLETP